MAKILKINFCFPEAVGTSKDAFVGAVVRDMRSDKNVGYAGYIKKEYLKNHLVRYFDDKSKNT